MLGLTMRAATEGREQANIFHMTFGQLRRRAVSLQYDARFATFKSNVLACGGRSGKGCVHHA